MMNYFAKFEKFLPHSIIIPSFMTVRSKLPALDGGRGGGGWGCCPPPPYKLASQNTTYKQGLSGKLQIRITTQQILGRKFIWHPVFLPSICCVVILICSFLILSMGYIVSQWDPAPLLSKLSVTTVPIFLKWKSVTCLKTSQEWHKPIYNCIDLKTFFLWNSAPELFHIVLTWKSFSDQR